MKRFFLLFVFFIFSSIAFGDETICPVVADNSIAAFDTELSENSGSSKNIKIKGRENYPVLKFNLSKIPADANIEKAELVLFLTNEKMKLRQVGYSTIPIDWEEGKGAKPEEKDHQFSCFLGAYGPKSNWGRPGYRFLNVINGNAGNVSGVLLAEKIEDKYKLVLPGRLISAMKKDQIGGLALTDESGWWGGEYSNIYFYSHEAGVKGPQLKITWSKSNDKIAPSAPQIKQFAPSVIDGEVLLEITCGGNDGATGMALGFDIKYVENEAFDWAKATDLPRMDIPRPEVSGTKFRRLLRGLKPGVNYTFGIRAYDEVGNYSEVNSLKAQAGKSANIVEPGADQFKFEVGGPLVLEGLLNISAVDENSKIEPVTGKILVGDKFEEPNFTKGNLNWDGKNKAVTIQGVKGEFVCFQLFLENISSKNIDALKFKTNDFKSDKNMISVKNIRILREWYINKENIWYSNAFPELIDKNNGVLQLPYQDNKIEGQKNMTLYVETFVPYQTIPGKFESVLVVFADGKEISVPIKLNVLNIEIPKELSFIIELNAYGVSGKSKKEIAGDAAAEEVYQKRKQTFFETHRLAHFYRTGYNPLGYGHSGSTSVPYIPEVQGLGKDAKIVDWSEWDEWMNPILSGKLFEDLPRGPVPMPHSYMPFYENYPMPITEYLGYKLHSKRKELKDDKAFMPFMCENDVLVADGFSQAWKDGVYTIGQEYRKHFEEKKWFQTEFHLFCNNKLYKGKDKATSLWTLDEPSFGRDFGAINFLGLSFLKPFEGSKLKMVSRADVSRPDSQGNRLDKGVTLFVSSRFGSEHDFITKRMQEFDEEYWVYGGGGKMGPNTDMNQLIAAYIKMWNAGCVGGLVHWTSFAGATWDEYNPMGIVLKGEQGYKTKPTASDRLVSLRRAQQDIELMTILSKKPGWNRYMVARYVEKIVNLASTTTAVNAEDPGDIKFSSTNVEQLVRLRLCLQQEILK